jgi:hypothetical protein
MPGFGSVIFYSTSQVDFLFFSCFGRLNLVKLEEMLELIDQNFEEILKEAQKPVLIDFWAEGLLPYFILETILEKRWQKLPR